MDDVVQGGPDFFLTTTMAGAFTKNDTLQMEQLLKVARNICRRQIEKYLAHYAYCASCCAQENNFRFARRDELRSRLVFLSHLRGPRRARAWRGTFTCTCNSIGGFIATTYDPARVRDRGERRVEGSRGSTSIIQSFSQALS